MVSRFLILDLETIADTNCEQWMPTVEADKRLTDATKIADDVARKKAAVLERAPLDPDLCQIVTFGFGLPSNVQSDMVLVTTTLDDERHGLELVWGYIAEGLPLLGYGLTWFDAGVLVRRSQLLGVEVPDRFYDQGKYRHPAIIELADRLTLNGMIDQQKGRGLDYHCKRLGIDVPDEHSGKDIAELWKAGNLEGIKAHCAADLKRIRLLAQRLGVIPAPVETMPDVSDLPAGIF